MNHNGIWYMQAMVYAGVLFLIVPRLENLVFKSKSMCILVLLDAPCLAGPCWTNNQYYPQHLLILVITHHITDYHHITISSTIHLKLKELWQVDGDAEYQQKSAADGKAWADLKT